MTRVISRASAHRTERPKGSRCSKGSSHQLVNFPFVCFDVTLKILFQSKRTGVPSGTSAMPRGISARAQGPRGPTSGTPALEQAPEAKGGPVSRRSSSSCGVGWCFTVLCAMWARILQQAVCSDSPLAGDTDHSRRSQRLTGSIITQMWRLTVFSCISMTVQMSSCIFLGVCRLCCWQTGSGHVCTRLAQNKRVHSS